MNISPPFVLRENYNEEVLSLLESVTLGSNGARYQHQMIAERIQNLYHPLFLNLERRDKVLGNITFCRRPEDWYIRYFAFDIGTQASTQQPKSSANTNSGLKKRIGDFFQEVFQLSTGAPATFYAYIDPRNERSLWMSQNFGFISLAKIATQTFSRVKPKKISCVKKIALNDEIKDLVATTYGKHPFYFTHHTFNDSPFYALMKEGEMVAFAKTYKAAWKILRLPGKNGRFLKNIIPFVPRLRKVLQPDAHSFTVVDSIWCKEGSAEDLETLLEGILYQEQSNSIIWWVDEKEGIYQVVKDRINWGLLHKVNGVQSVDLVVKSAANNVTQFDQPTYVTGFDFI